MRHHEYPHAHPARARAHPPPHTIITTMHSPKHHPPLSRRGGVVRIGDRRLERGPTRYGELVRGFDGRKSFWTFVFEFSTSMWLIEDIGQYQRATTLQASAFDAAHQGLTAAGAPDTRPVFLRAAIGSAIVNWGWSARAVAWTEVTATKTYLPGREAAYSLAGRVEAQAGGAQAWTVYTTTRSRLFRVRPALKAVEVVRMAPEGTIFRGVALPSRAWTPAPSPTASRSPSKTRSAAATPSRRRKATP